MSVTEAHPTFLFADLAGYTALTEAHGDEAAAEIVARFTSSVRKLLADHGAQQIKTVGDEVMAKVDDPEQAVILGLRIVEELAAHAAPPVRVGMSCAWRGRFGAFGWRVGDQWRG
ncbi:MAG: adenylate/guanylate cyclase domain-containing protein [Actinomycetota bacterium]|nr:adenylate/guanylate cyclase domain-containing protein [Actinomycetota bacterium]